MTPGADSERERLQADAEQRARALDTERSFIVEAPAGAGKTELLAQRFLALLARVAEPEQIVALTFTRQAAAEMRERILSRLSAAALDQEPAAEHQRATHALAQAALAHAQQRQWNLLQQPERLHITTLDALCARLARQMPLLSRLGSQARVCSDALPHYERAAKQTLSLLDAAAADSDHAALLERVLARYQNEHARLQQQLQALLTRRDAWLALDADALSSAGILAALRALVNDALGTLARALPLGWQAGFMPVARHVAAQADNRADLSPLLDWQQPLHGHWSEWPQWRALAELLLTQAGKLRSATRLASGLGLGGTEHKPLAQAYKQALQALHDCPAAANAWQALHAVPPPSLDTAESAHLADLLALLKLAGAHLWLQFQQAGVVDFSAVALQALEALGRCDSPSELQLQLDTRISHLLVDEFQDTSPLQLELLRRLCAGWQAGDGRSLFLVGDPMQSIYRFRAADVGLFLQVRASGLGPIQPEALHLYRNNRSQPLLVDWVNRQLAPVLGAHDDLRRGAVRFSPASATRTQTPAAQVCWHALLERNAAASTDTAAADAPPAEDEADAAAAQEAQRVLALIRATLAAYPQGSIAVLVRARSHLQALVQALRLSPLPLPFQALEIETLGERQPVQDLLSLTHALHHLGDRLHWLALLRAPWCGLRLADLHALAADTPTACVWDLIQDPARCASLSADGQQRLAHLRSVLGLALAQQGRTRPRRWVEGVWQALNGPACLQSQTEVADAQAFFELLERCSRNGSLELERLEPAMAQLYAAPDPAGSQVQLMTIHKSKGLEFDTVILPGLQRPPRPDAPPLLLWEPVLDELGHERLLLASAPERGADEPKGYRYLRALAAERSQNEARRLLYVAVTRARERLHLLATARLDSADQLQTPRPGSLLALLWPQAEGEFERVRNTPAAPEPGSEPAGPTAADAMPPPASLADFVPQLQRLRYCAWPSALAHTPQRASAQRTPAPPAQPSAADALAADIGTLVHRYLELIARDGLPAWPLQRLAPLQPAMRQWLQERGHPASRAAAAAQAVQRHLRNTLSAPLGRWLLQPHEQAASELALGSATPEPAGSLGDTAARVQWHVLDRTFVHAGRRWIVDFKTSSRLDQRALWQAQLQRYRALFDDDMPVQLAVFLTQYARLLRLREADALRAGSATEHLPP